MNNKENCTWYWFTHILFYWGKISIYAVQMSIFLKSDIQCLGVTWSYLFKLSTNTTEIRKCFKLIRSFLFYYYISKGWKRHTSNFFWAALKKDLLYNRFKYLSYSQNWDLIETICSESFSVEFLVQQKNQEVYIHFSFLKHFHYRNTFILHLKQVLQQGRKMKVFSNWNQN